MALSSAFSWLPFLLSFPAFAENDGRRGRRMTATRRAIVALAMRLVVTFAMLHLLRAFHVGVIDYCQI